MKKNENFCPVRDVLSKVGDKWSVLVLYSLQEGGVLRFSELQRTIPDLSQKMLTQTLRRLEAMRLIGRSVYAEVPPRVEYRLSELGASLMTHLNPLIGWALDNRAQWQ